jgi:hypothetical protein
MKIIGTKSSRRLQTEWEWKKIEIIAWLKEWINKLPSFCGPIDLIFDRIEKISKLLENFQKVNVTAQWMESTLKNIER